MTTIPAKPSSALPLTHLALALAVVAVWGSNFAVIKVALSHLPPLLFASLRFFFVAFPAVFFIKKPNVAWSRLATYGILIGLGQFGVLYIAMNGQIAPGLASLLMQTQVFFTIGLSMVISGERVKPYQVIALLIAAAGIGVIIAHADAKTVTPLGLVLTFIASMSWAGGNITAKRDPGADMLGYVCWASLFSIPPLVALSLTLEGWPAMVHAVQIADGATWAAVAWQSVGNSLFGYSVWGWLLARHPAASVTPMALLVPVFGMLAANLVLGEAMPLWKLSAAGLVMLGLAINIAWPTLRQGLARA
jgi:O-acetylserine/cysteine efflux transporter